MNKNILFILMIFLIINFNVSCKKSIVQIDNTLVWQSNFGYNGVSISIVPIIYQNYIIYSANDSSDKKQKLIAFDKKTGSLKWEWHGGWYFGDFYYTYGNNLAIVTNGRPAEIYVINMENGQKVTPIYNIDTNNYLWGNIVGYGNNVFSIYSNLYSSNAGIYKNDMLTGQRIEIFKEPHNAWVKWIDHICLYTGNDNLHYLSFISNVLPDSNNYDKEVDYLFKFCIETNKVVKMEQVQNLGLQYATWLVYADANYFYTNGGGYNYQIKESDFTITNQYKLPPYTTLGAYPRVINNFYFFISETGIFCFNVNTPNSNYLWKADNTTGGAYFSAKILNDVVYFVGDGKHILNAIDVNTGQILWNKTISIDDGYQGSVLAVDPSMNYIYTATYAGPYCYKAAR